MNVLLPAATIGATSIQTSCSPSTGSAPFTPSGWSVNAPEFRPQGSPWDHPPRHPSRSSNSNQTVSASKPAITSIPINPHLWFQDQRMMAMNGSNALLPGVNGSETEQWFPNALGVQHETGEMTFFHANSRPQGPSPYPYPPPRSQPHFRYASSNMPHRSGPPAPRPSPSNYNEPPGAGPGVTGRHPVPSAAYGSLPPHPPRQAFPPRVRRPIPIRSAGST